MSILNKLLRRVSNSPENTKKNNKLLKPLIDKSLLGFLLTFFFIGSIHAAKYDIVPKPVYFEERNGFFQLTNDTVIIADKSIQPLSLYLIKLLAAPTGFDLTEVKSIDAHQQYIKLSIVEEAQSEQSYHLEVNNNFVEIIGSDQAGLFYGIQTLFQLMPAEVFSQKLTNAKWKIPKVIVKDAPRFEYRGLLVDITRHFFDKNYLKKIIERMAMHKLNKLHLHLTDDPGWRVEIEQYPKLTSIGGKGDYSTPNGAAKFLSKAEIKELVAYAALHHIEIIPEIDMPGHAGAAAKAYPEYFDGNITFNMGKKETYHFVADILDEVIGLFPSSYIHFGGDELRNHNLEKLSEVEQLMKEKGFTEITQLEAFFDRYVADYIANKGRIPMGWDEVATYGVDKSTIITWWRGSHPEVLDHAVKQGHKVVMAPANYVYFDYPQTIGEPGAPWEGNDNGPNSLELIYEWEPIPPHFSKQEASLVIGVQGAIWTEFIRSKSYMEYMTFPRLSALAETAWSPKEEKDLADFKNRMKMQYMRYDQMEINYRVPGPDGDPMSPNSKAYITN